MHFLVIGGGVGSFLEREANTFIGFTTKKKTEVATRTKDMSAFRKCPYLKTLPFIVKTKLLKSGTLAIAAISGVRMSETNAETIVPKAAPMTTPTARSMTFPRNINCLNSCNIYKYDSTMFLNIKNESPGPFKVPRRCTLVRSGWGVTPATLWRDELAGWMDLEDRQVRRGSLSPRPFHHVRMIGKLDDTSGFQFTELFEFRMISVHNELRPFVRPGKAPKRDH